MAVHTLLLTIHTVWGKVIGQIRRIPYRKYTNHRYLTNKSYAVNIVEKNGVLISFGTHNQ